MSEQRRMCMDEFKAEAVRLTTERGDKLPEAARRLGVLCRTE